MEKVYILVKSNFMSCLREIAFIDICLVVMFSCFLKLKVLSIKSLVFHTCTLAFSLVE